MIEQPNRCQPPFAKASGGFTVFGRPGRPRALLPGGRSALPEPVTFRLDLHCHSTSSDGRYPAAEVLARALASNLDVLSLTDHDLPPVLPCGPAQRAAGAPPLRIVHGVEITGAHAGREYHLLVYFPGRMPDGFMEFCRSRARFRAARFDFTCESLGLPDRAPAEAHAGERALTRHHLAVALMATPDAGTARTWMDCYTLLKDPRTVPLCDLAFIDAVQIARSAGGFTSWAHPPLPDAQQHVAVFAAAGLQALEGVRPRTDKPTKNGLKRLAAKHGLLLTGGSDWHGWTDDFGHFALAGEHADRWLAALDAQAS